MNQNLMMRLHHICNLVGSLMMLFLGFCKSDYTYKTLNLTNSRVLTGISGMYFIYSQSLIIQYIDQIILLISIIACFIELRSVKGLHCNSIIIFTILITAINHINFKVTMTLLTILMLVEISRSKKINKLFTIIVWTTTVVSNFAFIIMLWMPDGYMGSASELHSMIHAFVTNLLVEYYVIICMLQTHVHQNTH